MRELITSKIEEVRYNGGHSTRKPSTVTMAVPHKFAVQVADLIEEFEKQGIEPEEGLIRLELVAHYAEPDEKDNEGIMGPVIVGTIEERPDDSEEGEQIIDDLTETIDDALEDTEEADAEEAESD